MSERALGTVMPVVSDAAPGATALGVAVRVVGGVVPPATATAAVTRANPTSAVAVQVLAANPARLGYEVQAEFANSDLVYLKEGAVASATSATAELQPGGVHDPLVNYTGVVTAIAASGSQFLKVTEY